MKIGLAQIQSKSGDVNHNLKLHLDYLRLADENGADLVCFPELSLSGYEPELAHQYVTNTLDSLWDSIQLFCNRTGIVACIGMPSPGVVKPRISMFVVQPHTSILIYSKQKIHLDEMPYFEEGDKDLLLDWGNEKIVPAICYESLHEDHAKRAKANGATIYLASVAKSAGGVEKAKQYYPKMAAELGMKVGMVNSLGPQSDFHSAGQSAIWNADGSSIGNLGSGQEGLLIWDVESATFRVA